MNTLKDRLISGWNFMRMFRLGVGIFIATEAFRTQDFFTGLIAAFFLYQALTNTGCCGVQECSAPTTKSKGNAVDEIEFEEIKTTKN
jgi:hypothetical protein